MLAFAATQGVERASRGADLLVLAAVALGGARLRRGRRAGRTLRRLAGDLLGARPHRAVPRRCPVTLAAQRRPARAAPTAWLGFAYVAVISMFLGFFAWYHGLALGGVAKIGQIQLAQPVLTLLWAALILGEQVTAAMVVAALAVLACVLATQRTRAVSRRRTRAAACPRP